jgi:hypothetical protein
VAEEATGRIGFDGSAGTEFASDAEFAGGTAVACACVERGASPATLLAFAVLPQGRLRGSSELRKIPGLERAFAIVEAAVLTSTTVVEPCVAGSPDAAAVSGVALSSCEGNGRTSRGDSTAGVEFVSGAAAVWTGTASVESDGDLASDLAGDLAGKLACAAGCVSPATRFVFAAPTHGKLRKSGMLGKIAGVGRAYAVTEGAAVRSATAVESCVSEPPVDAAAS